MRRNSLNGQILAAYDVGKWKRFAQTSVAVVYLVLSAGIVFGFAALKAVLIDEGVYRNLCTPDEINRDVSVCYSQAIRLDLLFTLAAAATNISALPVGTILDAFGPRATSVLGCVLLALGSILFALGASFPLDGYIWGYLFLSIGGPFVFITSFHLSNTFPKHSGLILAVLTAAFDCSSALFLLFRVLHRGLHGRLSVRTLFLLYLIVPVAILLIQFFLMPPKSYSTVQELIYYADEVLAEDAFDHSAEQQSPDQECAHQDRLLLSRSILSKTHRLLDGESGNLEGRTDLDDTSDTIDDDGYDRHFTSSHLKKHTEQSSTWGMMHMAPIRKQIQSPLFILITIFAVIQMLRLNYFIATIRQQYEHLLNSRTRSAKLNNVFDILFPIGGAVAAVPVGIFLDRVSMTTVLSTALIFATVIGVLGCIPNSLFAAYANVSLFAVFRPFFYTVISDYAATVFGFQTFGKVYGLMVCLAGVGNFLQTPLDMLTFKVFGLDPIPVNAILTSAAFVAGCVLVFYMWWTEKHLGNNVSDEEETANEGVENPLADTAGETSRLLNPDGNANGHAVYGASQQTH